LYSCCSLANERSLLLVFPLKIGDFTFLPIPWAVLTLREDHLFPFLHQKASNNPSFHPFGYLGFFPSPSYSGIKFSLPYSSLLPILLRLPRCWNSSPLTIRQTFHPPFPFFSAAAVDFLTFWLSSPSLPDKIYCLFPLFLVHEEGHSEGSFLPPSLLLAVPLSLKTFPILVLSTVAGLFCGE